MHYRGGITLLVLLVSACDGGGANTKPFLDAGVLEQAGSTAPPASDAGAPPSSAANRPRQEAEAGSAGQPSQPAPSAGRAAPPAQRPKGDAHDAGTLPPSAADGAGAEPHQPELSAADLLQWVLTTIEQHHMLSATELEEHFSPGFLSDVPPSQLNQVLAQLSDQLPPIHVTQLNQVSSTYVAAALDTADGAWNVSLQTTTATPQRIDSLWFKPASQAAPPPKSYSEASDRLQRVAKRAQLYVAEIAAGSCNAKHTFNPDAKLALGSAFKLWVLLALDEKLRSEPNRSWDDQLPIRDELKSLPSGDLQNQPAGTRLTLRQFASKMISISDNTAADHLIEFSGRMQVEAAQSLSAHSDPAANIPWLNTRELFALKGWASAAQVAAYRAASVADKRSLLEQLRALPTDASTLSTWTTPRMLDLEWFATGPDVCKVLALLGDRGQFDPQSELLKILTINPGVAFDPAQWSYVGYKGGSEPGVLNLSWLLRRSDGRWFSLVIALNDDTKQIDEGEAVQIATGVGQLLGAERD